MPYSNQSETFEQTWERDMQDRVGPNYTEGKKFSNYLFGISDRRSLSLISFY